VERRSIVINGDLGSGKSTVSIELSQRLGIRRISVGDLYREMAQQRGMTALQLNLHAELDDAVDGYVDQLQRDISASGQLLVVDSRLAWFFFSTAFKVHLVTEPSVAARRVLSRPETEVEAYETMDEAVLRLSERAESERIRFLSRYGADKCRLRNYDIVCDTTKATPHEVASQIVGAYERATQGQADNGPLLYIDPARIYPTEDIRNLRDSWHELSVMEIGKAGPAAMAPLVLGYTRPYFFVVDGHEQLSAAVRNGFAFVPATLLAEGDETIRDGLSAAKYFANETTLAKIYEWDAAHGTELALSYRVLDGADARARHPG
jgi:CMP/dCMP kinase